MNGAQKRHQIKRSPVEFRAIVLYFFHGRKSECLVTYYSSTINSLSGLRYLKIVCEFCTLTILHLSAITYSVSYFWISPRKDLGASKS